MRSNTLAFVAALALLATPSVALATEISTDVGFDNPSAWMVMGTHWTVLGSAANGGGATKMETVSQQTNKIKAGHLYRVNFTVTGRTTGSIRIGVGTTMMGSVSVPWTAPATTIADNFTTATGIETNPVANEASGDPVGAFRMFCGHSHFAPDDPVVYPGLAGRSHIHDFFGNTAVNASTDYTAMRTKGGTTCGNVGDPNHPINRSGYWFPAVTDGTNLIEPNAINLYYKKLPEGSAACLGVAPSGCPNLPNNLHIVLGYNFATGIQEAPIAMYCFHSTGAPAVPSGSNSTHSFQNFADMITAGGCPAGNKVYIAASAPHCWDGVHTDSPDHRSHLAYNSSASLPFVAAAQERACPTGYPYSIVAISWQIYFTADANFNAGKWHLSSDEMVANAPPGTTFHTDYFEGWSPPAKNTWNTYCEDAHNSCSGGALGDGTEIKCADCIPQVPGYVIPNLNSADPADEPTNPDRYWPIVRSGLSPLISTNGTFSFDITAAGAHEFNINGIDGFDGSVTSLSVQEISSGHKGPVTVHN